MSFYALAWVVVLLPLAGWGVSFLAALPRRAAQIALLSTASSLIVAIAVLGYRVLHQSPAPYESVITFWEVSPGESGTFPAVLSPMLGVRVDGLSSVMMAVVGAISVGLLWHERSLLRGDAEPRRLFLTTTLLAFAVEGVVASPNLFQQWLMSSIAGICAYLLVVHRWSDETLAAAGRRLAVHLAVGDLALLAALIVAYVKFGVHAATLNVPAGYDTSDPLSFSILSGQPSVPTSVGEWASARLGNVPGVGLRTLALLGALLLVAVAVRSLQVPLHAWLSEAVHAPVPVVGLLATLLPLGGVVLLARVEPLLAAVPHLLTVTAVAGALTALLAAAAAALHRDLLRVAILSVTAQWGIVVAAVGAGGFSRPLFAATVSSLLGAILFVVVPGVIRAARTSDIGEMGGLWPRMPWTSAGLGLWAAGVAGGGLMSYNALASVIQDPPPGVPPLDTPVRGLVALTVMAAAALATLAAVGVLLRLCTGEVQRRRGVQPERFSEVEPRLGQTVLVLGAVTVVTVALAAVPRIGFGHFVYIGGAPQALPWSPTATAAAILAGAVGAGIAWSRFRRDRPAEAVEPLVSGRVGQVVTAAADPAPTAARLADRSLAWAGRTVVSFDTTVTDALVGAVGEGIDAFGRRAERSLTPRLRLQLGVALAVTVMLAAAIVLGATGHLPGGGG